MTKHDAIKAYIEPKIRELAGKMLHFNFSAGSPDQYSLVTNYSGNVLKRFVRMGALKEYGFTILITKSYSTNADDINLEAMNFAQAIVDWMEDCDKKKQYPDFDDCEIRKVECLQNMPNLADIDMQEGVARYMVQCRVVYYQPN